jgi:LysM repeat protein
MLLMRRSTFPIKLLTMNRRPPHQPKRAFAAFLAAMTLTVQGPGLYAQETSLWQSRRDNARRWRSENAPTPAPEALPLFAKLPGASPVVMGGSSGASLEKLDWLSTLVAGNGWVREAHVSPRPGAPLIVHIQDAHGIEDAQRNIAALVARLSEATPETPIALEGAAGPIDVAGLRAFPDAALTKNIADFLLHRGLIAGPEHAALTTARPLPLTGAEDPELYLKNVAVFREARSRTADRRDRLGRFQERLDRAEETRASPALREFHRRSRDHDEGRVPLADYLGYLTGAVPPGDGPKSPNIDALLKAVRAEKTLDFKAVEAARRRLVDALVDRLPRPALARVLSDGLDVRAGRMSAGRYHDRLRATARAHGVDPRDFGPLPAYIDYVSLADTIDRAALLDEISDRRRRVEDALARTPAERALVELARDTALLGKALNHTLAPVDWRAYAARRPAFQTLSARLEALDGKTDAEFIPLDLKPFEDFCELAIRRNEALSQNLLAARAATGADRAVLIAGGFHTDGLTALWRQQQLSYVVVAPAMRDIPTDNPYLDILAHDPLPIEKMVAGERVYLSRPIALAASGPVRDFYLAMQRLLQNGLQVAAAAGVTVSRAPLRGGVAFRVGAVELHARFSDAAKTWAARWRNNFDPGPNAVGGMMFWLPRLWNASTPKPFHISPRPVTEGVSVPAEAGLAGLIAALGITTALGLPGDFDLFVRLSLAAYAVLHLGDFLTRDRRRAELNAGLAAGLATVAGLLSWACPPIGWPSIGLTPAQAAYGAFIALHAGVNLLVVRFPRVGRPAPPAMLSPPSLPAFAPTAFESSPNAVFRDRRAPISPPADAPVTDRQATLPQPLPRTAPDVPPVVAPRPALPRRAAAAPTAEILKERLATALFSLARPLSRKSLVDFRVRNLRLQADAFPGTSPYYHRLTSAWEKGVERTVLLTSWGPLRSVRIPLEDLPLPIVVQGLHLLLESREGVPALLFPNGKYIAPLDREDPRPMVFGREILAQATGTPVFELMDYSQNHFRFWRDGNDVVVEDLSTNGTVVPIRQTDGVPYDERTQFAGTVDGTRFHSTRRAQLFGFLMAGLLLTALLAAPLDVSAATLVTLDGGGLKALVERGDTLWGILDFAEGGGAAELVVRVKEIARLNNLSNPHLIFPGQEILLRAAVETAPAVTDTVAAATAPAPVLAPTVVSQAGDVMFVGLRVANVLLMTLAALALAGGAVAAALRRKSFPPPSTTFLSSDIDWSGAAEFQESPVVARPAPPAVPQVRSTLPWLLTSIAAARWARRALPRALNATWRSPARFALWVGTTANNGFHWLAATPTRLRTRSEKRRAAYDDPSTFFAHTRTGFEDPAGPAPARAPTRMRRWAATLYGWLNRSPLAFREVRAVPVDQITDDRLPVVAATDAREVLAIGPEDRALGEYTVEPPPLIEAPGPDFTLDAIENMPDGLIETAAPLYAADRALNRQTGLLAEEWRDQGLFDLPPSLVTYGDGENILMEIPFPKAAVRAIHRPVGGAPLAGRSPWETIWGPP